MQTGRDGNMVGSGSFTIVGNSYDFKYQDFLVHGNYIITVIIKYTAY